MSELQGVLSDLCHVLGISQERVHRIWITSRAVVVDYDDPEGHVIQRVIAL